MSNWAGQRRGWVWRRWVWMVGLLCAGLWAGCSSETDSLPATTTTGTGTGSGGTAGAGGSGGMAGAGGSGAAAGAGGDVGGSGGQGGGCPDVSCSYSCPGDGWPETDSCPSCACAAELSFVVNGQARPTQHVSMQVQASEFIGGIDRWVFDFLFQYDDPNMADEAEDVAASVRIMRLGPAFEPVEQNAMWIHPDDAGNPLEINQGTYTLYGFAVINADLTPVSGFLSIRRVNDDFQGHVDLHWQNLGPGSPSTVHVAAPFSVAVP